MKKIAILLAYPAIIIACSGPKEVPEQGKEKPGEGKITPSVPTLTLASGVNSKPVLGPEGGSVEVAFTASDTWTAGVINERAADWIDVSPSGGKAGSGKVTVSVKPNESPDERNASIRLACGSATQNIVLTQKQKDAFTASAGKAEFGKEGGSFTIQVKANIDFDYMIDVGRDWITYSETKALKTSNLSFTVSPNEDVSRREGQITVSSSAGRESFKIYQEGAVPTLVLTGTTKHVPQSGGTVTVEVRSNVDVTATVQEGVSWVAEITSKAMSTNTWTFSVAENDSNDSRVAEIYFTNTENKLSETVQIVQAQKNAIVIASDRYEMETEGGEIQVAVAHNVDFDVTVDADWIHYLESKAMVTETLVFVVDENATGASRSGTISFVAGSLVQTLTVEQAYVPPVEPEAPGIYGVAGLKYEFNPVTDQLLWTRKNEYNFYIITPANNRFLLIASGWGPLAELREWSVDDVLSYSSWLIGEEVTFTITQNRVTSLSPVIQNVKTHLRKIGETYMWFQDEKNKYIVIKYRY